MNNNKDKVEIYKQEVYLIIIIKDVQVKNHKIKILINQKVKYFINMNLNNKIIYNNNFNNHFNNNLIIIIIIQNLLINKNIIYNNQMIINNNIKNKQIFKLNKKNQNKNGKIG